MFRKLVSNLAFSPALVGQIGFYAKRLRKEEATRRIGLVFTVLALVIQSLAVFTPPEAANAASSRDFIYGGVSSLNQFLKAYDKNQGNIKDIYTGYAGITREEIASAKLTTWTVGNTLSWGRKAVLSPSQGEVKHTILNSSGTHVDTVYSHPQKVFFKSSTSRDYGWVGYSKKVGWFAISKACANLVTKKVPAIPKCPNGLVGNYPRCTQPPKMCTLSGKTHLLASDKACRVEPKCTIKGKTHLLATDKDCKVVLMCAIDGKTHLLATDQNCKETLMCTVTNKTHLTAADKNCKLDPVAACSSLKVTKLPNRYQLDATSTTANGATVTSYVYTIKRDGKVVKTITQKSKELSDTAFTAQTAQGKYTVTLTVKTTAGDKTDADCVKSFTIPEPKKCEYNTDLLATNPECQPCEGDTNLWIKDANCSANMIDTKSVINITQGNVDATTTTARAADKIVYTLTLNNTGKAATTITPVDDVSDVVEYATIIDTGGGTFDEKTNVITWPALTLKAGEKQTRIFTVKMLDEIPAMGTGVSDKASYDCRIDNTFGNLTRIDVDCPIHKQIIEQTVNELPHTGPRENMIFAGITLTVVAYFYARSRQMKKEVRLIRRDLNAGTI